MNDCPLSLGRRIKRALTMAYIGVAIILFWIAIAFAVFGNWGALWLCLPYVVVLVVLFLRILARKATYG